MTISNTLFGAYRALPSYISIVGFSKSVWIIVTFLTYSFYPSTHRTKIRRLTTQFIHAIIIGQRFDIGQAILDIITPYHDPSFQSSGLLFALLVSRILEDVDFEIRDAEMV